MPRYLGSVIGVIIGICLFALIPIARDDLDNCGGSSMEPGDACVSNRGGSYDYDENRDRIESSNTRNGVCLGIAGAAVLIGSLASAVRKSQAVADAPQRQAAWPVPTDLGLAVAVVKLGSRERLSLNENGFAYVDDTEVIHAAHWTDITDTSVTVTNNVSASVTLWVAGHPNPLAFSDTYAKLRQFIDRATMSAVEYQFEVTRSTLLAGQRVDLDDKGRLAMDQHGLIRVGDGEELLTWSDVARVESKNGFAHLYGPGPDNQWGKFRLLGPKPAAKLAVIRALTERRP